MPGPAKFEALRSSTRNGLSSSHDKKLSRFRIPFMRREKAAYLILRRVGCSINQIADAFGRSTSVVHRALKRLGKYGTVRRFDIRKLPYHVRMRASSFRRARLLKLLSRWETWICGEEAKPP